MTLQDLGYNAQLEKYISDINLPGLIPCRVTQEHRERYIISAGEVDYEAEVTGNLRYTASSLADFPAVGDWVLAAVFDSDMAIIHKVLPRKSKLERQAVGKTGEKQIISANIDAALIIQSIDNNFNINRLERYLTLCNSSGIDPVMVISKVDLATADEISSALKRLDIRDKKTKIVLLSNISHKGLDKILELMERGKTYCVVGSSGVGKSTLINNLLRMNIIKTDAISKSTNKGRHITTHRELFVLENGAIIIDTPGMKEIGITDDESGINTTFEEIVSLGLKCRFPDCSHASEAGCAVIEAIEKKILSSESLENYRKIIREQQRFVSTIAEKRKKDREFGKIAKSIMKEKKKNKF
jgi:ribosome biogenesis GTPase